MIAAALAALALAASPPAAALAGPVNAADYDAFWLWAAVTPQPVLARARSLYLLRGEVDPGRSPGGPARLIAQGGATPHLTRGQAWIVYRAHTLDWTPRIYDQILAEVVRWRQAGDPLAGVQIDFDAHTRRLDAYAAFLKDLRARLPADCKLSITGLLDWSSGGDPRALAALAGVVDEVILQTYQGRHTIRGYRAYLAAVERLRIPFKIGLVQGGEWSPPPTLAADPWFRGYVVFLEKSADDRPAGSRSSPLQAPASPLTHGSSAHELDNTFVES